MKKFLFGCAMAGCCLALPQLSAEPYYYPSQYENQCCEADFDGFYIGGNVGVFSHTAFREDLDGFLTDNSGWSTIDTDVTAGVILGYDWRCRWGVFGVVADWNWVNVDLTLPNDPNDVETTFGSIESEFDWFTTIRARGGITFCDTLLYLTLGGAVARSETTWRNAGVSLENNTTRWGWVGGVGAEFMAFCNWSFGFELLALQFSADTTTFTSTLGTASFSNSDSALIGRFILNYRFGDLLGCFCN